MTPSAAPNGSDSHAAAAPSKIEDRLFINGQFVPSISGKRFDVINPTTEKVAASVYEAGVEDVDAAVAAAKAAFPAWSELDASARGAWLFKLADKLEERLKEISYLDAISMGRPVHNDFTTDAALQCIRYYAGKALDLGGHTSLNSSKSVNLTFRQPYGVCAGIIPWNFPFMMLALKIAPALVTGNTMIIKSSEKAPLSTLLVAQCVHEIGFPKGVLNFLSGFGRPCGEAIAKHMEIRKLSFTGSTATGRAIRKAAAESNLKNVILELGGKSPLLIFDDADLAKAVPAAAFSILVNSGQVCIASSRVYVHEKIAESFIKEMKAQLAKIGNPADPVTEGAVRGPQADKLQFDRVMSYIDSAKQEGLNIVHGGRRFGDKGYFIEPTIITGAPETSKVVKEEIFGPVVVVNTFSDEDDALRRANDTEYGLYASVFTKDVSRALRVAKKLEAGSVGVNCTSPTMALDMPFGGWKASGDGRQLSTQALESWTEVKSVFIAV